MATYQPKGIDFAESAPLILESSRAVTGTPQEVWDAIVDYERWPAWFASLKTCAATSEPPTGVGSTRRVTLAGGAAFDERFIAWDERELWSFTGIAGPPIFKSLVERVTITPLDDARTTVTYRMAIEPKPILGPLVKLAGRSIEKNLGKALHALDGELAHRRQQA